MRSLARAGTTTWMTVSLAALLLLAGLSQPPSGHAHSYKHSGIAVGPLWAPPTSEGAAPVYGAIMNESMETERLVGASSDIAEALRFRAFKDGQPSWPDAIDIPPGEVVTFAGRREHLWLSAVKQPLQEGDRFEMTLTVEGAGDVAVTVLVEPSGGR